MKEEIIEADVLCIGGGIAGLMAAIRASEMGAKVIVAEKANTLRSGSGATGNDHFQCYIPEAHGSEIRPILDGIMNSPFVFAKSLDSVRIWVEKTFDIVKLWDSWGIPMKYQGKWEFAGHSLPGKKLTFLKYAGQDQKPILTREALKRSVDIANRVMVFDLITENGKVRGAIAADTNDDKIIIFLAKSVILCTGRCMRLYPSPTPNYLFNRGHSPATTGDGRAMAYRAGAELANMEITKRWAGPKYFIRCGKATWIGVIRDTNGEPIGPFVTKPERLYGDPITDIYSSLFEDYAKSGRTPIYMDCKGISEEDYQYMIHWFIHEGNVAMLNYFEEEGIDIRKNAIEFMTYELMTVGGIVHNEKCETSIGGLYAAGDEYFSGISTAATFGWIAGENAAAYVTQGKYSTSATNKMTEYIKSKKDLLEEISSRETGASWKEVNIALGQIMQDYAGPMRSASLLHAGLNHLRRLKQKSLATIMATNQHELMRCLEVINLLDIAELVFAAAIERKETRGGFNRSDYPFTNPLMNNKEIICKKMDGELVTEWREIKR